MHKLILYSIISYICLFSLVARATAAERIVFSDNFNDQDLSDWTVVRNSQWGSPALPCMNGTTQANWQAVTGSIKIDISGPPCVTEIVPNNLDLSRINSYKIEYDWLLANDLHMDRNFALLWKDTQNWIGIKLLDDSLIIQRVIDGQDHVIPGSSISFPFVKNETYRFTVVYEKNNHIKVLIDNNQVVDSIDLNFASPYQGKYSFAFQASVGAINNSTTSFDNITVTSLDDTLGVNLLKQGEEPWGPLEYNSALSWVPAGQGGSFKEWACALTSAAMILNFHGINLMPNGDPVNPQTLNAWLLKNNGYFNGGNVSFAAIAALTKELSEQYGHPALEYSRNDATAYATAKTEIDDGRPVIVAIPGHFVVADGVVQDNEDPLLEDLFIKDPAYLRSKLSEHNVAPTSTRIFTPSNTDVSYLTVVADPTAQVQIYDSTDHLLETTSHIEQLENPEAPGQFSPAIQLIEIPKPAAGVYRVELVSAGQGEIPMTVSTITPAGEIDQHLVPSNTDYALLTISSDAPSQIEYVESPSFSTLRQTISQLRQQNEIKNDVLAQILDSLAAIGEEAESTEEKWVVIKVMKRVVTSPFVKKQLTVKAKTELIKQLNALQVEVRRPRPTPQPSPQASPTPSPSATPTATPVPTPSPTPGATPSPTPTACVIPSPSPSPSPTPAATATPSPSPSPSSTPSPTPVTCATPAPSPAP